MIIDGKNPKQRSILTNKCFYQTTAQIMHDFEKEGYTNPADETLKAISAYRDIVKRKVKNNYDTNYNKAFGRIDYAIEDLAHKVFYDCGNKGVDLAYQSFEDTDHVNNIVNYQRIRKNSF